RPLTGMVVLLRLWKQRLYKSLLRHCQTLPVAWAFRFHAMTAEVADADGYESGAAALHQWVNDRQAPWAYIVAFVIVMWGSAVASATAASGDAFAITPQCLPQASDFANRRTTSTCCD
ncbi:MAG: hypothetical protein ACKPKO_05195, partial [Candidatus Fonsibacter sp.]